MKPAVELIEFQKDGKEFPYVSFYLLTNHFSGAIEAVIDYYPRDENGEKKFPLQRTTGIFKVADVKTDKTNRAIIKLILERE